MKRTKYYVEPHGALVISAAVFMAASAVLRIFWCVLWPEELEPTVLCTQGILPVTACILFIFLIFKYGKKAIWLSFFPAAMGVLFFVLKATGFAWWHQLLCTLLYLLVAVLYGLTVFGVLPTSRLLIPLFGLPLAFHIFVEDLVINFSSNTPRQWFQECSVLCIMAGLLCVSLAMKKESET
ncbi:MAG: hypothetical protein ACI3VB_09660 [Oscillospiraceae bacterium]